MIDLFLAAFGLLEPLLLVAAGALATGVGSGLNERRKRRYALEDRELAEHQKRNDRKRALLIAVLDNRGDYIWAQHHAPKEKRSDLSHQAMLAMLNKAAESGDSEVIKAVDYFLSEDYDDEGELLDLASRKICEMEVSPKELSRWNGARRKLGL